MAPLVYGAGRDGRERPGLALALAGEQRGDLVALIERVEQRVFAGPAGAGGKDVRNGRGHQALRLDLAAQLRHQLLQRARLGIEPEQPDDWRASSGWAGSGVIMPAFDRLGPSPRRFSAEHYATANFSRSLRHDTRSRPASGARQGRRPKAVVTVGFAWGNRPAALVKCQPWREALHACVGSLCPGDRCRHFLRG